MTANGALEGRARGQIPHAEIWEILHVTCRAHKEMPDDFPHHWPDCREYRFMGALGFGGKVWAYDGRWYVNCYPEDMRPDRKRMIESANKLLAALQSLRDTRRQEIKDK